MTSTLLMRLCGPLQSWGTQSRFTHRDTGREPSKSGIVGLLCAALGKPRVESDSDIWPRLAELSSLRMGVRIDQPGTFLLDYHTAQDVAKAGGGIKESVLSFRHYLMDACFLVGLEGRRDLLVQLDRALRRPVWQLALGRKCCVPALPIAIPESSPDGPGLVQEPLEMALRSVTLMRRKQVEGPVEVVLETSGTIGAIRNDVPICFASRRFGSRLVVTTTTKPEEYPTCISPDFC